jgi:HEPN domain-containing protein
MLEYGGNMATLQDATLNAAGPATDGLRLLTSAAGFASLADAGVAAWSSQVPRGSQAPIVCFTLAQAAELALKAYLLQRGIRVADLGRGNLGHDLASVLSEARARGMQARVLPAVFFNPLNSAYRGSKQLQYPNVDGFVLPPLRATREMVEELISEATNAIQGLNAGHFAASQAAIAAYPGLSLTEAHALHP